MNWHSEIISWLSLSIAILASVIGTVCMKLSNGLQKRTPTLLLFLFYFTSFVAMTFALRYMELSTLYAVWSGIGTLLVAAVGGFYFNEPFNLRKILFLILIVIGVAGIHL